MAITVTNKGLFVLASENASTLDLRVAVFTSAIAVPAVATIRDYNFLSSLTGVMTEAVVSGYSRQDVTGVSLTENDATDAIEWRGDAMVLTSVAAGETWIAVAWYKFNASDAAAELIAVDEPAATLITNGGNVTLPAFSIDIVQQ